MNMYQSIPAASLPVLRGVSSASALAPSLWLEKTSVDKTWLETTGDRKHSAVRASRPAGTAKQARPPRGGPR